jgi:sugar phosphate isomerase/epimerase
MNQTAQASTSALPVLGAALTIGDLERLHNWVMEGNRDLELQEFCYAEILNANWRPLADRYKQLLDGHQGKVGIHGPFWGFEINTRDPDIAALVSKRMLQALDVCEYLGADMMVVHSPYTAWDVNNSYNFEGDDEATIRRCHRIMGEAVKKAEDIGVTIVIENVQDKDPHARVELAKSFDSDAVRVSLDTGHAYYAHGMEGAPPVDYFVAAAGKMLAHVHLQDADGCADRHWAPGEGTLRWRAVMDSIRRHCDAPRLILELKDNSKLITGAEFLEGMGLGR